MLTFYFILSTLAFALWTVITYKVVKAFLIIIKSSYKVVYVDHNGSITIGATRCTFQEAVRFIETENRYLESLQTNFELTMLDRYTYEITIPNIPKPLFICKITT